MTTLKSFAIWLFIFQTILLSQQKALGQHSEIGIKVVLSGALMFGPYYTLWANDHNALNVSILAAYEGELVIPFALNAGYSAYFFNTKWRPEIGLQYSYLISPKKSKSSSDPNGISILSLTPGVQLLWNNTYQNAQSKIWLAYIFDKNRLDKKFKILPIGLDFSYGYKFH